MPHKASKACRLWACFFIWAVSSLCITSAVYRSVKQTHTIFRFFSYAVNVNTLPVSALQSKLACFGSFFSVKQTYTPRRYLLYGANLAYFGSFSLTYMWLCRCDMQKGMCMPRYLSFAFIKRACACLGTTASPLFV